MLEGRPILFCLVSLLLHSHIMPELAGEKCVVPECTKESCCLSSSLYLASDLIGAEIAEKNGYMPGDTAPAHASKKLHHKYTQALAANCLAFFCQ